MNAQDKPAFSYSVPVGKVSANPVTVRLSANEAERKALARLWDVSGVAALEAELHLTRWKRDGVRVKGQVHAEIVQPSVVSLEPVTSSVDEPVEAVFVPEGSRLARVETNDSGEVLIDAEGPDLPETFSGDRIDVGSVVAEFVALAIEPYPRLAGETFNPPQESAQDDGEDNLPFAALKNWQKT